MNSVLFLIHVILHEVLIQITAAITSLQYSTLRSIAVEFISFTVKQRGSPSAVADFKGTSPLHTSQT